MKILITVEKDWVSPRFDLTREVLIAENKGEKIRTVILPRPSAEELCSFILTENVDIVVCGGIEETYYQYLLWKKVKVIDRVIGPVKEVLKRVVQNRLREGKIIR
uniref:Dinitrogenase iron-molybdenum cofactor biosynthesis domain-containing protein n=1 Tax=Thermodesulfobacterium geofontis TaxID=1295609 RepID=A0A7V5XH27_9BACT